MFYFSTIKYYIYDKCHFLFKIKMALEKLYCGGDPEVAVKIIGGVECGIGIGCLGHFVWTILIYMQADLVFLAYTILQLGCGISLLVAAFKANVPALLIHLTLNMIANFTLVGLTTYYIVLLGPRFYWWISLLGGLGHLIGVSINFYFWLCAYCYFRKIRQTTVEHETKM